MTALVPDKVDIRFSVHTGTGAHALADLSRRSVEGSAEPELEEALAGIGDRSGETWLHLLGLCLQLDAPASLAQLIDHIAAGDAGEFRQVLLGVSAWSWRNLVGEATLLAAAGGDRAAAERLLSDDRYYGGSAPAALATILPLDPEETRGRFLEALERYRMVTDPRSLEGPLFRLAGRIEEMASSEGWLEAIEELTGYRYFPEPEARRVVLMPHLAGPGLVLAQHDEARLIVHGDTPPPATIDLVVELGRALSDPSRVQILAALAPRPMSLGELVEASGLTRSTVHHHLRLLRSTGLVAIEGNARAYRYSISDRGRRRVTVALQELLHASTEDGS